MFSTEAICFLISCHYFSFNNINHAHTFGDFIGKRTKLLLKIINKSWSWWYLWSSNVVTEGSVPPRGRTAAAAAHCWGAGSPWTVPSSFLVPREGSATSLLLSLLWSELPNGDKHTPVCQHDSHMTFTGWNRMHAIVNVHHAWPVTQEY